MLHDETGRLTNHVALGYSPSIILLDDHMEIAAFQISGSWPYGLEAAVNALGDSEE